jgi:fumarate reductase flavoprotein subunit
MNDIRRRYADVELEDKSNVYNTDLIQTLELGAMIDVAGAIAVSAFERKESRGSHQRLDHQRRDDETYLKHSLAHYVTGGDPRIEYRDVVITRSEPGERVYGGGAT